MHMSGMVIRSVVPVSALALSACASMMRPAIMPVAPSIEATNYEYMKRPPDVIAGECGNPGFARLLKSNSSWPAPMSVNVLVPRRGAYTFNILESYHMLECPYRLRIEGTSGFDDGTVLFVGKYEAHETLDGPKIAAGGYPPISVAWNTTPQEWLADRRAQKARAAAISAARRAAHRRCQIAAASGVLDALVNRYLGRVGVTPNFSDLVEVRNMSRLLDSYNGTDGLCVYDVSLPTYEPQPVEIMITPSITTVMPFGGE